MNFTKLLLLLIIIKSSDKGPFKCYVIVKYPGEKNVTKVYGSTLLALQGVDMFQIAGKKALRYT